MFATRQHYHPHAHAAQQQANAMAMLQMELAQMKQYPTLNPHFGMVEKYLDVLTRLMDSLVMTHGGEGYRVWLIEVQTFTRQLHKRLFELPLTMREKQAVLNFAAYWRNAANPAFSMGSPDAQLVLINLTEVASY